MLWFEYSARILSNLQSRIALRRDALTTYPIWHDYAITQAWQL